MAFARLGPIELAYESFHDQGPETVLLIMGLGAPMTYWEPAFCEQLAAPGYRVVRFDNRDVGQSTVLRDLGIPDVLTMMARAMAGETVEAPYTLSDMARDTVGLLDTLGVERAHLVGASLGGMVAQVVAIEHPERVASLTAIMSTTGDASLPTGDPTVLQVLFTPAPKEREALIEHRIRAWRAIAGPRMPFDEERARRLATAAIDRGVSLGGFVRQLAAVVASGSRRERLRGVKARTLVLHGTDDPLIPVECGRDIARYVPDARLVEIDRMGHDMPPAVWPTLLNEIHGLLR
jgi:pimeloyl-ACP methyl ester carboxylesterase